MRPGFGGATMTNPGDTPAGPDDGAPPGPLDRALRLFGDVRAGEGATVLLMCLHDGAGSRAVVRF